MYGYKRVRRGVDNTLGAAFYEAKEVRDMGQNGYKDAGNAKTVLCDMARDGSLPVGVNSPVMMQLMEMCRSKNEKGMDTSHIERFIEEGIIASIEGKTLYAEVMLQIAYDSLQ